VKGINILNKLKLTLPGILAGFIFLALVEAEDKMMMQR
jgi:hypothetical protein